MALLEPAECERIAGEHADEFPYVWRSMVDDLRDESIAGPVVVIGAIAAAVAERRPPEPELLEQLEHSPSRAPSDALALVLEAGDLWSVFESTQVDEALLAIPNDLDDDEHGARWNATVAAQAERLGSDWHRERLAELVARLHTRLPLEGYPTATATLAAACSAFAGDPAVRAQLPADLLADSLSANRLGVLAA